MFAKLWRNVDGKDAYCSRYDSKHLGNMNNTRSSPGGPLVKREEKSLTFLRGTVLGPRNGMRGWTLLSRASTLIMAGLPRLVISRSPFCRREAFASAVNETRLRRWARFEQKKTPKTPSQASEKASNAPRFGNWPKELVSGIRVEKMRTAYSEHPVGWRESWGSPFLQHLDAT